jgi:hypothetical protein
MRSLGRTVARFVIAAIVMLNGCALVLKPFPEQNVGIKKFSVESESAALYYYRPFQWWSSGCNGSAILDGEILGSCNRYFFKKISPGHHKLGTYHYNMFNGLTQDTNLEFTAGSGEIYYARLRVRSYVPPLFQSWELKLVDTATGQAETVESTFEEAPSSK